MWALIEFCEFLRVIGTKAYALASFSFNQNVYAMMAMYSVHAHSRKSWQLVKHWKYAFLVWIKKLPSFFWKFWIYCWSLCNANSCAIIANRKSDFSSQFFFVVSFGNEQRPNPIDVQMHWKCIMVHSSNSSSIIHRYVCVVHSFVFHLFQSVNILARKPICNFTKLNNRA